MGSYSASILILIAALYISLEFLKRIPIIGGIFRGIIESIESGLKNMTRRLLETIWDIFCWMVREIFRLIWRGLRGLLNLIRN